MSICNKAIKHDAFWAPTNTHSFPSLANILKYKSSHAMQLFVQYPAPGRFLAERR